MAGRSLGFRPMTGSGPEHKGKRFLFTGKYSGCLVTSNGRKGNAEKAEGSPGPCSWPALTHCDLKPSHFYSCSSICQVEGSPALHRSHGIPKTACHLRVKSKEQAPGFVTFLPTGPLTSALGRHMPFSFAFGDRHGASSKPQAHALLGRGGIWMAPGSLGPRESDPYFPHEQEATGPECSPRAPVVSNPGVGPDACVDIPSGMTRKIVSLCFSWIPSV